MRGKSHRQTYTTKVLPSFMVPRQPIPSSKPPQPLSAQALYEQVLALWHGGKHDTLSIGLQLSVDEAEVCRIIEECEGRGNGHG